MVCVVEVALRKKKIFKLMDNSTLTVTLQEHHVWFAFRVTIEIENNATAKAK